MTQAEFYAKDAFVLEVDFTMIDAPEQLPPLQNRQVDLSTGALSFAAVAFAGVLTITANMFLPSAFSTPIVAPSSLHRASGPMSVASADVGAVHDEKAQRAQRLFKAVPLNDVERLADPDYGL
jgi:hypothetical protein